ncbi:MAG: DUF4147 domain-containing protein [Planctomycetaceae bacterium]|nr:DUF4147 domain-containing protein [Planctomycetaceae bacterium]
MPGDDIATIASGPTVSDPTPYAEARAILAKYGISEPESVLRHLERGIAGGEAETPKPDDPQLACARAVTIATPQMSLEAAASVARAAGVTPFILGNGIASGPTRQSLRNGGLMRRKRRHYQRASRATARR